MSFPHPLPPLDLSAPFDRHRARVEPSWVDGNGHMNVGCYVVAFDRASDTFADQLGVGWDYVAHGLGSVFVVEAHVTYERELHAGDPLRITTQLIDYDAKRMHLFHAMYHADAAFLAATNELMMLHIDRSTRRASAWRPETEARLDALFHVHKALPRPQQVGRVMAVRR